MKPFRLIRSKKYYNIYTYSSKWGRITLLFHYKWLEDVKFNFFVENKSTIFVRLFNIRDEYDDLNKEKRNAKIDLNEMANDIWSCVNSESHKGFQIIEMSLNHVETINEMRAHKRQWPSNVQINQNTSKYLLDTNGNIYLNT